MPQDHLQSRVGRSAAAVAMQGAGEDGTGAPWDGEGATARVTIIASSAGTSSGTTSGIGSGTISGSSSDSSSTSSGTPSGV
jgi:hypothetical protein